MTKMITLSVDKLAEIMSSDEYLSKSEAFTEASRLATTQELARGREPVGTVQMSDAPTKSVSVSELARAYAAQHRVPLAEAQLAITRARQPKAPATAPAAVTMSDQDKAVLSTPVSQLAQRLAAEKRLPLAQAQQLAVRMRDEVKARLMTTGGGGRAA